MGQPEYSRHHSDEEQSKQNERYGLSGSSYRSRLSRSPSLYILDLTLALAAAFLLSGRHAHRKVQQFDLGSDITCSIPQIDRHIYKGTAIYCKPHQSGVSQGGTRVLEDARSPCEDFFVSDCQFRHRLLTIRLAGQGFVEIDDELVKGRAMPKRIAWKQDGTVPQLCTPSIDCIRLWPPDYKEFHAFSMCPHATRYDD
jgi:hypothetical protein